MCRMCSTQLYIKTKQYTKPVMAPLTPTQELRDKLIDLTGEIYLPVSTKYCPFCGAYMRGKPNKEEE